MNSETETGELTAVAGVAPCSAWRVKGIAMVPVEVEMVVMARTAGIAECIAQAKFKASPTEYIVSNSHDDSSAHDWVPFVEPNIVPNLQPRSLSPEKSTKGCKGD